MRIAPGWMLSLCLFLPVMSMASDWWRDTALKPAYQALVNHNPDMALRTLISALEQPESPPVRAWASLFWTLIEESNCGRDLNAITADTGWVPRLIVMRKNNQGRERFQLKVAIDASSLPERLTLLDVRGRAWLAGAPTAHQAGYAEWEGKERLSPIPAGLYRLQLENGPSVPVVIPPMPASDWVRLDPFNPQAPIRLNAPQSARDCSVYPALVWFDRHFNQLGAARPIGTSASLDDIPGAAPEQARWVSIAVTQRHHQPGLTVDVQQRLTWPAP